MIRSTSPAAAINPGGIERRFALVQGDLDQLVQAGERAGAVILPAR
jgi:hypothetical protein